MNQLHRIKDLSCGKAGEKVRGQVGSQEAQPWVPRGEFYFNSIANVKGDFRKRGQGQRDREHGGSKKTYSLMNWKRLIFNMLICYAVML